MGKKRLQLRPGRVLEPEGFEVPVCAAGYEWHKTCRHPGDPDTRPRIALVPIDPNRMELRNPLKVPDLFRRFAEIPVNHDGVREFANAHGLLRTSFRRQETAYPESGEYPVGDVLGSWQEEVFRLRSAIGAWDAIRAGDRAAAGRFIVRYKDYMTERPDYQRADNLEPGAWLFVSRGDDPRMDSAIHFSEFGSERQSDDHWTAVQDVLIGFCNAWLQMECVPLLRRRSSRATAYTLTIAPQSLVGCLWWQFSRLVAGQSELVACAVCGRAIEHSAEGEGSRADRRFCSNACKLKNHRQRVKQAKELKAEGKSVAQIAKKLDAEPDTIRGWLESK
jgi:predicted nucleic acid-binding Zn ribbon protein